MYTITYIHLLRCYIPTHMKMYVIDSMTTKEHSSTKSDAHNSN